MRLARSPVAPNRTKTVGCGSVVEDCVTGCAFAMVSKLRASGVRNRLATMSQLSAAATDAISAVVLVGCAAATRRIERPWWSLAFGSAAGGCAIGVVHHLAFRPSVTGDAGSAGSFALAGVALSCALAAMLVASTRAVRPARVMVAAVIGVGCALAFAGFAALGSGTVGPLVYTQLPSMLGIVGLWTWGARHGVARARPVASAMGLIALSALGFVPPVRTVGGWIGIEPVTWQHLLQLPGMVALSLGIVGFRFGSDQLQQGPATQRDDCDPAGNGWPARFRGVGPSCGRGFGWSRGRPRRLSSPDTREERGDGL